MNFLMTWRHADLMRGLFDLAMTWLVAALWVVPPAGLCAMVWRAFPGPRDDSSTPPAAGSSSTSRGTAAS